MEDQEGFEARVWRLVNAAFAEMSTDQSKLRAEFDRAEDELRTAITEYVHSIRPQFDNFESVFGKVNELQWDFTAPNFVLVHDPDAFGGDADALVATLFSCEVAQFEAMSDEDGIERIVGHLESTMLELADMATQTSRIRNRVDAGLKRHIDNLLAKLPDSSPYDYYDDGEVPHASYDEDDDEYDDEAASRAPR